MDYDKIDSKRLLYLFSVYYRTMYSINQCFIKLCGLDICRQSTLDDGEECVVLMNMLSNIARVLPYNIRLEDRKAILPDSDDALIKFNNHPSLKNIKSSYKEIIDSNNDILFNAKRIRNKYEHEPHLLNELLVTSGSCDEFFSFTYEIEKNTYEIKYSEMRKLVIHLNMLYDNIRDELIITSGIERIEEDYKLASMYRTSLLCFNRIYESDVLHDVGRIMWKI